MMAAYSNPDNFDYNQEMEATINYVVDAYGPTDLDKLYHMQTIENYNNRVESLPGGLRKHLDITHHLFGFDPDQDTLKAQDIIKKYSPINYLNQDIPPTIIIHGDKDQIVPVEQSIILNRLLDSLSIENEFHLVTDVNHAFRGASKEQKKEIQTWIVEFIEKHYYRNK